MTYLKKDIKLLKQILKAIFKGLFIWVSHNSDLSKAKVTIKRRWYSLNKTVYTYRELFNTVIPKMYSENYPDKDTAFLEFRDAIDFDKSGLLNLSYLYDTYTSIPKDNCTTVLYDAAPIEFIVDARQVFNNLMGKLTLNTVNTEEKITCKTAIETQLILPFVEFVQLTPKYETLIVATISTGDPKWDKEIEDATGRPLDYMFTY